MPPLISIVLPTYNGARFLADAIQSVIDQTVPQWELIVVDSYSTDDTPQILAHFATLDDRIIITHNPREDGYLPGALNAGFRLAKGAYLTWFQDDNLYRPHALETFLKVLQANPEIDIVYSDYTRIDSDSGVQTYVRAPQPNMLVRKSTVDVSFLYKREVDEAIGGYDETTFLVEDYDFWLRASMQFKLKTLHEDLHLYRFHEGTLTSQRKKQVLMVREGVLSRHLPHLPWANRVDLARGYLHLSELAVGNGSSTRAIRYLLTAIRKQPFVVIRHVIKTMLPRRIQKQAVKLYQRMQQI
ncbi:MAG: glycosyltransferase [Anaerolineae bacterium]|nr:glycosyltransferase [Anaerolineae bacterium]